MEREISVTGTTDCDQRDKKRLPWETGRLLFLYSLGEPNALGWTSFSKFS